MKYSQSDGKPPSYKHANIKINRLVCKVLAIRKRKLKNPLLSNLLRPFLLEGIKNSAKNLQNQKICVHLHPLSEKATALVR